MKNGQQSTKECSPTRLHPMRALDPQVTMCSAPYHTTHRAQDGTTRHTRDIHRSYQSLKVHILLTNKEVVVCPEACFPIHYIESIHSHLCTRIAASLMRLYIAVKFLPVGITLNLWMSPCE